MNENNDHAKKMTKNINERIRFYLNELEKTKKEFSNVKDVLDKISCIDYAFDLETKIIDYQMHLNGCCDCDESNCCKSNCTCNNNNSCCN